MQMLSRASFVSLPIPFLLRAVLNPGALSPTGHPYINTSRLKGHVVAEKQEGGVSFEGYMQVDPEAAVGDDDDDYE